MSATSSIYETLQIMYAFIPKELLLIILAGLVTMLIFNSKDKNNG